MNVTKGEKDHASVKSTMSLKFSSFEKMRNFKKISNEFKNCNFFKEREKVCGMMRHSASPPCGNLVDGSHNCHTKTIAKQARVEPRTQMRMAMEKLF